MLLELIGRQVQTYLDKRVIKHSVLFAAGHISLRNSRDLSHSG